MNKTPTTPVTVVIVFRDDTTETFHCNESPAIGDKFMTLYMPDHNGTRRTYLCSETIKKLDWWYERV